MGRRLTLSSPSAKSSPHLFNPTKYERRLMRTVKAFVEDLVSDGRDLNYILTVAHSTRWKDKKEEIKREYATLRKRLGKR